MQRFANRVAMAAIVLSQGLAIPVFADEPSPAHISFINTAAQAGLMEVEAAWRVVGNSKNVAVKEFAYRIIYDYDRINSELARIAEKRGVSFPAGLDAEHSKNLQLIREATPQTLDATYLAAMIVERGKLVELLQSNLLNPDAELAVFSSYNLPRVREHKRVAEDLNAGLPK
jgi:putative membrane protein